MARWAMVSGRTGRTRPRMVRAPRLRMARRSVVSGRRTSPSRRLLERRSLLPLRRRPRLKIKESLRDSVPGSDLTPREKLAGGRMGGFLGAVTYAGAERRFLV